MENQPACIALRFSLLFPLLVTAAGSQQNEQCPEILSCATNEVFLSWNRTLAPLEMVRASQQVTSGRATDVYNFGFGASHIDTWCTSDRDPDPYIDLELTSPVLITKILFSGRNNADGSFFVTNFTLEYSPANDTTVLSYYTTDTGSIKYFSKHQLNTFLQLTQPLLTQHLRFRPLEWFDEDQYTYFDYVCLGVGLYGCMATEGISRIIPCQKQNVMPSIVTTESFSQSITTVQPMTAAVGDSQVLSILLPIFLLSIIINVILVGYTMYACNRLSKHSKCDSHLPGKQLNNQTKNATLNSTQSPDENPYSTNNEAYGIVEKYDDIELKGNESYKSHRLSSPRSGPNDEWEYSYTITQPTNLDVNDNDYI